jgi:hypothetical protein
MNEVVGAIATNRANKKIKDMVLDMHNFQEGEQEQILEAEKRAFMDSGKRQFFTELKGQFKNIPVDVFVTIKGKQKDLPALADKLTNLLREASRNPQGASMFAKQYNELLEASGFSPVDFSNMTAPPQTAQPEQPLPALA